MNGEEEKIAEELAELFSSVLARLSRTETAIQILTRGPEEQNEKIEDLEKGPGEKSLEETIPLDVKECLKIYHARINVLAKNVDQIITNHKLLRSEVKESKEIREEDNVNYQFCIKDVRGNIEYLKRKVNDLLAEAGIE